MFAPLDAAAILDLQHKAGNRAVARLLKPRRVRLNVEMPPATIEKTRLSSTCTVWAGPDTFRIRARLFPPVPVVLIALACAAACYAISRSGDIFEIAVTATVSALCFIASLVSYELSFEKGSAQTWVSVGPIRYSARKLPTEGLTQVTAFSIFSRIYGTWRHCLRLKSANESKKDALDLWSAKDAAASATALAAWLKIAVNIEKVHLNRRRAS